MNRTRLSLALVVGVLGTLCFGTREALAQQRATLPPVQPPLAWELNPRGISGSDLNAGRLGDINVSRVAGTRSTRYRATTQRYAPTGQRRYRNSNSNMNR